MWRHLDTSSDRLLGKFFLSACKMNIFLLDKAGIPWNNIIRVVHVFTKDHFINGVFLASLGIPDCF